MEDYRTDYQIREWHGLADLAVLLNTLCNEGWRVDSHKLSGGKSASGWTIFCKHVQLKKPLLERSINVGQVYTILNRVCEPGSEQARTFDAEIKRIARLPGDED
jgi:hypothetical protein